MSRVSICCRADVRVDLLRQLVRGPHPFGHQFQGDTLGAGVGVQPCHPRAQQVGVEHPLLRALVAQRHAELGRGRRRAHRSDRTAADLRVDPQSHRRAADAEIGDDGVDPVQLLRVVGVDRDAVGESVAQLVHRLGRGVEDDPFGGDARGAGQFQLADAGHLRAHALLVQQREDRHERGGLHRERVLYRDPVESERFAQLAGGAADPRHVEQAEDRRLRADQALLGGGAHGRLPADDGFRGHGHGVFLPSHCALPAGCPADRPPGGPPTAAAAGGVHATGSSPVRSAPVHCAGPSPALSACSGTKSAPLPSWPRTSVGPRPPLHGAPARRGGGRRGASAPRPFRAAGSARPAAAPAPPAAARRDR